MENKKPLPPKSGGRGLRPAGGYVRLIGRSERSLSWPSYLQNLEVVGVVMDHDAMSE
jgi:hypothetical protein